VVSDVDDQVLEIDFQPEPRAASDVRRAVASWLRSRGFPTVGLDDLLLVVSELVTNAVVHARTAARFELRWDGRRATVEVTDGDRHPPALPDEAPAIGGRGLFLIDRLTTAWGSDAGPSGKTVWATIETGP
jgi:anti-sigma regulatory factor (Ser/Thr protein kinase)